MVEARNILTQYRDALIARYRTMDDPVIRDGFASGVMDDAAALVTLASDMRARVVAELHMDGWSFAKIATELGLSRSRVQQLVQRGRDVELWLSSERT